MQQMRRILYSGFIGLWFAHMCAAYSISQKLVASGTVPERMGYTTAIYESTIFAGAYGSNSGYIFSRVDESWSQTAVLTAQSEGEDTSMGFPSSVSLYQQTAVAGARSANILGMDIAGIYPPILSCQNRFDLY
jgi:hypothetical protein